VPLLRGNPDGQGVPSDSEALAGPATCWRVGECVLSRYSVLARTKNEGQSAGKIGEEVLYPSRKRTPAKRLRNRLYSAAHLDGTFTAFSSGAAPTGVQQETFAMAPAI
jgi:hypothetical protein